MFEECKVRLKRDYVCLYCRKGCSTTPALVKRQAKQGRTQPSSSGSGEMYQQSTTSIQLSSASQQEAYLRMIFNSLLIWPIFSVYSTNISYLLNLLLSQYRFSIKYVQLLALQTMFSCVSDQFCLPDWCFLFLTFWDFEEEKAAKSWMFRIEIFDSNDS